MSDPPTGPSDSEVKWTEDVSTAFTAAMQVAFERRLPVFLTALSTETLRLFASESKDWGEALTKATICVRALLTGDSSIPSEEDLHRWSARVQLLLILESLERRGILPIDHREVVHDPLSGEPLIQIIGRRTELL